MSNPVIICSNPECESIIWKGQRVWHKGSDLYCGSECLIESFQVKREKKVIREKVIPKKSTKQERVEMMREVYERRKRRREG